MQTISIVEPLTVLNIRSAHKIISDAVAKNTDGVVVDLKDVSDCDTSGVQLVIAVWKYAANKNRKIDFKNISDAVANAFSIVGIDDINDFFSAKE
ncbi:MAG: STAS domain-containing protein [Deltaproteobacteria bacterium]|nr:STAS domain-containing protein [Deltaproteobacteria bacterium]